MPPVGRYTVADYAHVGLDSPPLKLVADHIAEYVHSRSMEGKLMLARCETEEYGVRRFAARAYILDLYFARVGECYDYPLMRDVHTGQVWTGPPHACLTEVMVMSSVSDVFPPPADGCVSRECARARDNQCE